MTGLHVVMPADVDDARRPSGGNVYDRRVCEELRRGGRVVLEHFCDGNWPHPEQESLRLVEKELAHIPDGATVLVDGLIASCASETLVAESGRLRLVILLHMPFGTGLADTRIGADGERRVLESAHAIVTTSDFSRAQILRRYGLDADRVSTARPGVAPAPIAAATREGSRLLCVAALTPHKAQDVLLEALSTMTDLLWRCDLIGALRDPEYAALLYSRAAEPDLAGRIRFHGPVPHHEALEVMAMTDLLILPSRGETYGMVLSEALARGVPVIATDTGGVREAIGEDAEMPGLLVPAGSSDALADAIRSWLSESDSRDQIRAAAVRRRATLTGWNVTAARIARVLDEVAA